MKTIFQVIFQLSLLLFLGNPTFAQVSNKTLQPINSESLITEDENVIHKINYETDTVLKVIYVIDRSGIEAKQHADSNSITLGTYQFGTKLDVIDEKEEWYGVRERITRNFLRDDVLIESTGWEMVYVVKNKTGLINEITLIPSDLNIISNLTVNEKTEYFESDEELTEYLKIELIDKQLFDSNLNSSVNFLINDTTEISKKKGILKLECQNKTTKFTDRPEEDESYQIYNYIGQFDFLNKYVICGFYYESFDYSFVDKTTGEITQYFGDFPNISADKKHLISIYTNPYETTADLELYSINENVIKHVITASFNKWMPTLENSNMFWSTDGYLYLTVNHVNAFWKEDGNLNEGCQYIRIKTL